MNIYAVRDRLIDYWMTPFAAPEDKAVLASLAFQINTGDPSAISQAPQHFEVHRLAKVTEDGRIIEDKEFLCQLDSLIRPGVRPRPQPGTAEDQSHLRPNGKDPAELASAARAYKQASKGEDAPEEEQAHRLPQSPGGTD